MTVLQIKRLFSPFTRRIWAEILLNALLTAVGAGGVGGLCAFILSLFVPVKI